MQDLYQDIILDEYKNPQHKGRLAQADLQIEAVNSSCGDEVIIYARTTGDKQQIVDLRWEGEGCVISQASMSLLSQKIISEGLTVQQVAQLKQSDLLALLGMETISAGREKCLMIGVRAFQKGT